MEQEVQKLRMLCGICGTVLEIRGTKMDVKETILRFDANHQKCLEWSLQEDAEDDLDDI